MKSWFEFIKVAEELDGESPVNAFKINNADNFGVDYEHTMNDLLKLIITKYNNEFISFLKRLHQRGDEEVGSLLKKIDKPNISYQRFGKDNDTEEIVPNDADRAHSDVDGE